MQIKTFDGMIEIHEYLMACMYMWRLQAIISFLWDYSKPFEHFGQYVLFHEISINTFYKT